MTNNLDKYRPIVTDTYVIVGDKRVMIRYENVPRVNVYYKNVMVWETVNSNFGIFLN
jgi:hypothetical protein